MCVWSLRTGQIVLGLRSAPGIEPATDFAVTTETLSDCCNCGICGAAQALHSERLNWLNVASIDADLLSVVLAWEGLPSPIQNAIKALVKSCPSRRVTESQLNIHWA